MKGYDFYSCPHMQRHLSCLQPHRRPLELKPWPQHRVRPSSRRRNRLMRYSDEAYHKITAEEAKQMMDEGNATVVDCARRKNMRPDTYSQLHSDTGGVHR